MCHETKAVFRSTLKRALRIFTREPPALKALV
jgi:hypothetical protein